jgi:hypothetical protein
MTVFPLVISWFLTLGYVPTMNESVEDSVIRLDDSRIATVAQIGIAVSTEDELFSIHTNLENFQYVPDGSNKLYFSPFRIDYSIGLEVKPNDNIRFNVDHECDHPVTTSMSGRAEYRYNSAKTSISVTVSGKSRLFE